VVSANFSPDGRWIVTVTLDNAVQVWSAATMEPLTPPMRQMSSAKKAWFLAGGLKIGVEGGGGTAWIVTLPIDERPADDLVKVARLLSGPLAASEASSAPVRPEPLEMVWQQMKAKYPSDFTTSPQEVEAWHESQALSSELGGQWFAAAFHLKQLLLLRPGDSLLLQRLALANEHFKAAN
jgi:hypothetical protein